MRRILSYIFVTIVSLLFLTHDSGINDDHTTLSGALLHELYHVNGSSGHEDNGQIIYDSSDNSKAFKFCRFGRSPQGAHVLSEKQCFNTGSFIHPVLLASVCITSLQVFQSYDTHIPDRLKRILYPKHSFW